MGRGAEGGGGSGTGTSDPVSSEKVVVRESSSFKFEVSSFKFKVSSSSFEHRILVPESGGP